VTALYWCTSLAALVGVWLNIRKHVACFWIWTATNGIWACVDFMYGIRAQAALQLIYLGLSLYGIRKWSKRAAAPHQEGDLHA
jgi:nicotinamide mononucleotide transporter